VRAVTTPGRLVWGVSGLVTMLVLTIPGFRFIVTTGDSDQGSPQAQSDNTVTRTVTVSQPVTSLTVQSYGAPVRITGGRVSHVEVTETFAPPAPPAPPGFSAPAAPATPAVAFTVRHGHLSVGSPACSTWEDCVGFVVIVPRDVTVTVASQSGPVTVSGVAAVNGDSGGGSMDLSGIDGPVNVTTDSGPLRLANVAGPVQADTGGGSLSASAITAATATLSSDGGPAELTGSIGRLYVETGGGPADITMSAAPDTVTIDTDGGPAMLAVPGGPYALTASSDGGPQSVTIASSPTAARTITVTTGGGPLQIAP
jgi:hypothetical protein